MSGQLVDGLGPYLDEDGNWWVPVEGCSFKQARDLVVGCLWYSIPADGTLIYRGKEMQWLDSEHEGHNDGEYGENCPFNRHVLAYHFEEHQRDEL